MAQPFTAAAAPPAGWAVLDRPPEHAAYPPGAPAPAAAAGAVAHGAAPQHASYPSGWHPAAPQQAAPLYPPLYVPPPEGHQQWGYNIAAAAATSNQLPATDAKWVYQPPPTQQQHFVHASAQTPPQAQALPPPAQQAQQQQQQQPGQQPSKVAQFARWCGMLWCTGCIWSSGAAVGSQVTNAVIDGMRP